MTTTIGDRATVKCARCTSNVVFHDVIGIRKSILFTLLPGYFEIDTDRVLCPDCEAPAEYYEALAEDPPLDPENLPSEWLTLIIR